MSIVDAGVDYLRLTGKPGSGLNGVVTVWEFLQRTLTDEGHKLHPWSWQGYKGTKVGAYCYGSRDDGMIFQASGAAANNAMQAMKGVDFLGNVARLDAQATITHQAETRETTEQLFDRCRVEGIEVEAERRRNLALHRQRNHKDTLYVGSRNSLAYLCVYDAAHVHPDRYRSPARRFECRYANEAARDRYTHFQQTGSVTCTAASLVIGHLMSINLRREWFGDIPPIAPMTYYKPKDDEKSLIWIENFVAKTVKYLISKGHGPRLAQAFGVVDLTPIEEIHKSTTFKSTKKSKRVLTSKGVQ